MVRIFKTNVERLEKANGITAVLSERLPAHTINFDLEDCDKILRVNDSKILNHKIIELVNSYGFHCEVLP